MNKSSITYKTSIKYILMILVSSLIVIAGTLLIPYANKYFIDQALINNKYSELIFAVALFTCGSIFSQLFYAIKNLYYVKLESNVMVEIRRSLHKKIHNLDDISNIDSSHLVSLYINDANRAKQKYRAIIEILLGLFQIVAILTIIIIVNVHFVWLAVLTIGLYAYWPSLIGKKVRATSLQIQENLQDITGSVYESLNMVKEVRIYNLLKKDYLKVDSQFSKAIQPVIQQEKYNALYTIANLLFSFFISILIFIGGLLVFNNNLSIGTLVAIITYLGYISDPVQSVVANYGYLKNIEASVERINDIFRYKERSKLHKENQEFSASNEISLVLENISLEKNGKSILNNISLSFTPNEFVAIIGTSGSGKSSLLNIISRMQKPSKGDIYIQGKHSREIPDKNYYDIIKHVFQNSSLFRGTLEENLFSSKKIDRDTLYQLIRDLDLSYLLGEDPLNFLIEKNPSNLSGGQQQRLSLLRALILNPPILLLDEVTSSQDEVTEIKILEVLKRLRKDKITIFVTHKAEVMKYASKTLKLENGEIVKECQINKLKRVEEHVL